MARLPLVELADAPAPIREVLEALPDEDRRMPKQKTHKGTKKRFRLTAKGKAMHRRSGTSHLATRMSQKRKRNLRGTGEVGKASLKAITKALGGNSY